MPRPTTHLSSFDAIIVATAQTAGCAILLSEDLNAAETMAGVRILNPFANSLL